MSHTEQRRISKARLTVSVIFFVNGMGFASWVPHIPDVQQKFALSESSLGLSLLSIAVGAIISMPLTGWLVSIYGSRPILRVIGFIYCLVIPLLVITPTVMLFIVSLFLFGATNGAMDVSMNAHGVLVEKKYGSNIMSSFHGLFSLGGLTGASLGGLMLSLDMSAWQHMQFTMVVLAILLIAVLPGMLPPQEEIIQAPPARKAAVLVRPSGALLRLGLFAFFVLMVEGAMADWTAIYIRDMPQGSRALGAAGFAGFSLTMAIGRLTGDFIIRRTGKAKVVRLGMLLAASGLLVAAFTTLPLLAVVGFALVGAGVANVTPTLFGAAGNVPGVESGKGIAAVTTSGYTGFLVGPPFIGFVAEGISLAGSLMVLAVLSVLVSYFAAVVRAPVKAKA